MNGFLLHNDLKSARTFELSSENPRNLAARFLGLLGLREAETWKFDLREAIGLTFFSL